MGIVNRRNAVMGWAAWRLGKRIARRKARGAVPRVEEGRPNRPAIVSAVVGLAGAAWGALWFWRRRKGSGAEPAS
jgi:hypothetical protein